jgi:flavin reductase (NADH)
MITKADFRTLMAGFPTGVAVVTSIGDDGKPRGMTCSSVCSVSLDPPILLICLRVESATLRAVSQRRTFALNLLHDRARATAELFASAAPDRFERVQWHAGHATAEPYLPEDAHTVAECRVVRMSTVGDHVVVFGQVVTVAQPSGGRPLLYGMRQYAAWPIGMG